MRKVASSLLTGLPGDVTPVWGRISYPCTSVEALPAGCRTVSCTRCGRPARPEAHARGGNCRMNAERSEQRRLADLLDLHDGRLDVRLLDDTAIRGAPVVSAADRHHRGVGQPGPTVERRAAGPPPTRLRRRAHQPGRVHDRRRAVLRDARGSCRGDGTSGDRRCLPSCGGVPGARSGSRGSRRRLLWLQLGIASREAGQIASAAGLDVVMDRCTVIEHARLIGR